MTKRIFTTCLVVIMCLSPIWACTNFLVGKKASKDGSTMISYSADSYALYGELYHWPAKKYKAGEMLKINEWDTGKYLGQIPQVAETYNVIGNINQFQLTIAETTFGGREELQDTTAIMDYGSLIYTTLQRAKTAREAIKIMTDLVSKYGYYSTGESFSIADPNEVWIMEMIGKGVGNKGAVWVAVRIPDDCVASHANQARIRKFPLKDKNNCMYAPDVISFARKKGYFSGKDADFSFADAYAPLDFGAQRFCEARVWSFFNKINKNMSKYVTYAQGISKDPMPLYIKPDHLLSLQELQNYMRDHYEGTELDWSKDAGAGAYACPYRNSPLTWKIDGQEYFNERPIATQQTGFTFVSQMRSWLPNPIGGVLWFGMDDAAQTVYYPIYCANTSVPKEMEVGNGDLLNFSWTSAFWMHNWVSNMVYNRYSDMIKDLQKVQSSLENQFAANQSEEEKKAVALYNQSPETAVNYLTDYSNSVVKDGVEKWKKLGEYLIVKYMDGVIKKEENGQFKRNPYGQPEFPSRPGYSKEYYKNVAKETGDRYKIIDQNK